MKYLLCLDKNYTIELGNEDRFVIMDLEQMLDNMVDLVRSYGIDDEEILEKILEDTDAKIVGEED